MQTKKIDAVNLYKFLGVLGVLFYHLYPSVLPGGFFGVNLFFLMSGFLIGKSLFGQIDGGTFSFKKYYIKRFFRIYPALVVVILWTAGVVFIFWPYKMANMPREIMSVLLGCNNYWQIVKGGDYFANISQNSPFIHLWYIGILIQFYLISPVICFLYKKLSQKNGVFFRGTLLTVSALYLPIRTLFPVDNITDIYYSTFCRVFPLLLGIFLRDYTNKKPSNVSRFASSSAAILFLFVTSALFVFLDGTKIYTYRFLLNSYALFCSRCFYLMSNKFVLKVGKPIIDFICDISYEIYLWQYPVIFIFTNSNVPREISCFAELIIIILLSVWLHFFIKSLSKPKKKKKTVYKKST